MPDRLVGPWEPVEALKVNRLRRSRLIRSAALAVALALSVGAATVGPVAMAERPDQDLSAAGLAQQQVPRHSCSGRLAPVHPRHC